MKIYNKILQLTLFLFSFNLATFSQSGTITIFGSVYDCKNNETLIGVSVFEKRSSRGTFTDSYGRYSLTIPITSDSVEISVTSVGYQGITKIFPINNQKIEFNWKMESAILNLNEVVISAEKKVPANEKQISNFKVTPIELKSLPSLSGENDLLKLLQLTPGIQYASDFNSNLYVRGGDYDQNLFLLDNMPLYHVSHIGGFLSTFNSDIIKSAEIHKGSFPARFGGRLSSVLEVHTIDGDMIKHNYNISLGFISSKIFVNGPIKKDKSSYLVSLRKNTLPLDKIFDLNSKYKFYDANIKLNYKISDRDRVFLSFYNGYDKLKMRVINDTSMNSNMNVGWGNIASSLKYNRIISARLFSNFIIGYTSYYYSEQSNVKELIQGNVVYDFSGAFNSKISESFAKTHLKYIINNNVDFLFGYDISNIHFLPGESSLFQSGNDISKIDTVKSYPKANIIDQSLFCELNARVYGFYLNLGLRGNIISNQDLFFPNLQPRINISRSINEQIALKVSYSVANQPFHLVTNNGGGVPVEYRIQTMKNAPPSKSKQIAVGTNFTTKNGSYEFIVEGFYRHMKDLVTLKDGVYFTLDFSSWENILETKGTGEGKGIEVMARKISGKTSGWIGATLSKSTRQFETINFGKPYPFKFDRRWEVKMLVQHQLSKKIRISSTFAFATGNAFTLPQSQMTDHDGNLIFIYGERNNFREKPYHRLDVALNYALTLRKTKGSVDFSILNIYNRQNPYYYYTANEKGKPVLYQQSQFPFLPSISLNLFF